MYILLQKIKSLNKEQLFSWLLVILICFLCGLRFVYGFRNIYIKDDRAHYFELADSIYNGKGFVIDYIIWPSLNWQTVTHPDGQRQPLFPLLLAFSFLFFGENIIVANFVSTFFSILTTIVIYKVGKNYGKNTGLLASFIYLLNPYAFKISINAHATMVYGFFLTVAFWQFTEITNKRKVNNIPRKSLLAYLYVGLPAGLAWLSRPEGIVIIPTFFLFLVFFKRKNNFKQFLIISLIIAAIMMPWMIRNYSVFGTPFYGNLETKLWVENYEDIYGLNKKTGEDYFEHHTLVDFLQLKFFNFVWSLAAFSRDSLSYYGPRMSQKFIFFLFFAFVGSYYLYRLKEDWFFILYIYLVLYSFSVSFVSTAIPLWINSVLGYERYYVAIQPLFSILASVGIIKTISLLIQKPYLGPKFINQGNKAIRLVLLLIVICGFHYQCAIHSVRIYETCRFVDRHHGWTLSDYNEAALWLKDNTPPDAIIMTREPQSVHHYSQRQCIMIPNENLSLIIAFGEKYNASYLVLTERLVTKVRPALMVVWEGEMEDDFKLCVKTKSYRIYSFVG